MHVLFPLDTGRYDLLAHIRAEPAGIAGMCAVAETVIGNKIELAGLLSIRRLFGGLLEKSWRNSRNSWKGRG